MRPQELAKRASLALRQSFLGEFKSKGGLRKLRVLRKPSRWLTGFERSEAVRRCSNGVKAAGESCGRFLLLRGIKAVIGIAIRQSSGRDEEVGELSYRRVGGSFLPWCAMMCECLVDELSRACPWAVTICASWSYYSSLLSYRS